METYRHGNLVYFPITKHASTFYTNVFANVLQWDKGDSSDIVFGRDHVFAHIISPDRRHTKGTAQALVKHRLNEYVDHPVLEKLIPVSVFDLHAYPLVVSLGEDWCYQIDWIPLDLPNPKHTGNYLTQRFLEHCGINIDLEQYPKLLVADREKTELMRKIDALKLANPHHGTLV